MNLSSEKLTVKNIGANVAVDLSNMKQLKMKVFLLVGYNTRLDITSLDFQLISVNDKIALRWFPFSMLTKVSVHYAKATIVISFDLSERFKSTKRRISIWIKWH